MLKNDLSAILVEESLSGTHTTEEELRQLYKVQEFSTDGCSAPEVGLTKAIKTARESDEPAAWYGRGKCHVDVTILNPSRMRAMQASGTGFGERFYRREMCIPLDFTIRFDGSDLDLIIESCEIAELILPPADADDEFTKAGYDFLTPRYGSDAAWKEFSERAEMVGIDTELIRPAYLRMIKDVSERMKDDREVLSAIRSAYQKEEETISYQSLDRFYGEDVLTAKKALKEEKKKVTVVALKRGRGHLTVIDGGKNN